MIILGIDPGIGRTGFGIIEVKSGPQLIRCGCLTTAATTATPDRLAELTTDLEILLGETHPDLAVIEQIFFGVNHKTAILTAQARGAILSVIARHGIEVQELTPLQIKSRLVGFGRATKQQIQKLVTAQLKLTTPPQPDDAADALAAALCAVDPHKTHQKTR